MKPAAVVSEGKSLVSFMDLATELRLQVYDEYFALTTKLPARTYLSEIEFTSVTVEIYTVNPKNSTHPSSTL